MFHDGGICRRAWKKNSCEFFTLASLNFRIRWAGWRLRNLIFFSRISKDYPSIRDDHFIRDIHKQRTFHPFDLLVSPFLNLVQTYLSKTKYMKLTLYCISLSKRNLIEPFECLRLNIIIWLNFFQIFFVITSFNK